MTDAPDRSSSPTATDDAVDGAGIGRYRWDLRTDRWVWSPELYAIHGLPETTPVTTNLLLACEHPEDRDHAIETIAAARRDGGLFSCQHRICRADTGAVRTLVVVGEVEQDRSGVAVSMHGFFVEVSDVPHTPTAPPPPPPVDTTTGSGTMLGAVRSGTVMALSGDIDMASHPIFERALAAAAAAGPGNVCLDISRVGFMDLRAVERVLSLGEQLSSVGRRLLVLGVPPIVRRILQVVHDPRTGHMDMLADPDPPLSGAQIPEDGR